ncbi:hypothetical protein NM688_g712 [Phlebia brevispora]|uniref:Uncharacterized protein n=1 Tax=Phlebia brevispora TaxID=194682 RepID=A0ACC1TDS2_9APHY|nr:hypothetical protein NM688_g712 [Phlebia brevispora]
MIRSIRSTTLRMLIVDAVPVKYAFTEFPLSSTGIHNNHLAVDTVLSPHDSRYCSMPLKPTSWLLHGQRCVFLSRTAADCSSFGGLYSEQVISEVAAALVELIVPSILLAASLSGVTAVPLKNAGVEAKRDDLGDILSGVLSVAVDVLGPSVVAEVAGPIESLVYSTDAISDLLPAATSIFSLPPQETSGAPSPTDSAITDSTVATATTTDTASSTPVITGVVTLPGGGLWTPAAWSSAVQPTAIAAFTGGTIEIDSTGSAAETVLLGSATSTLVASSATTIATPAAGTVGVVASLPDVALSSSSPAPTPSPPSKRDGNILTELFGGEIATLANEVMSILPSPAAAKVSGIAQELFGTTSASSAASASTQSGSASTSAISGSSTSSPTASASQTNAAGHVGLTKTSFVGTVVVVCSMIFGALTSACLPRELDYAQPSTFASHPTFTMGSTRIERSTTLEELIPLSELLTSPPSNNLSSGALEKPELSSYLAHLTDLALPMLEAEPTTLSSSSAQLTNALTTLCYTSYPTFLSLHNTTSTLSSSLASLSSSLDSLLSALPSLETSARTFAQETRDIQKDRRKASLVLEQHDKLYDVLSLPMLLDACVRNHSYNEALLLANHASALFQRFPSNPLIQSVKAECDARVQAMLSQLLGMLSEQAKLPALFRAVTFLRKMEVLEEQELALAFLTGRGTYLEGALKAVDIEKKSVEGDVEKDKETYARFLKRYLDVWREGVYDVVTQYTTIFLDRAASTSDAPPATLHILLRMFTTHHLQALLQLLRETLLLIPDPSLLTSLLTQLTYCANSFARIGMDFKPLLAPIFLDAVRNAVSKEFEDAMNTWCEKIPETTAWKGKAKATSPKNPSDIFISPSALSSPPQLTQSQLEAITSGPVNVPPQILVSYPPLALYLNALLTALNGLRMLAPVELFPDLNQALETTLAEGGATFLHYAKDRPWLKDTKASTQPTERDRDAEVLRAVASAYFDIVVPFVLRALSEGVYGIVSNPIGEPLRRVKREWEDLFPCTSSADASTTAS